MSRFRFFLSEAWEIMWRDRAGMMASLTALIAVLFLLAVVLMAGHNIRGQARNLESRKGLEVFVADDAPPERIAELERAFRSFGEVTDVTYRTRDQELREIEQDLGGVDVESAMGENPLSPSFRISLTPEAAARTGVLQKLAAEIGAYEGVDEVIYGGSWITTFERGLRNLYLATAGAGILAGAAVLLVLWNTVKLAFLRRRETVRILRIVGATSSFIRTPYLLLGGIQTAFAALTALGLAALLKLAISQMMPGVRFVPIMWGGLFLGGAIVLGVLSSIASIEPALRNIERHDEAVTS
jgi:cell division transport system permease protein